MKSVKMKRYYGFTLAEVLITLAIIGVVAALSIPAVISNSQQQEFKTGLRKAVSVLNSAITMNMALDGESPYDNANLMGYLMKHMAVMATLTSISLKYKVLCGIDHKDCTKNNAVFYTTDGMRFEFMKLWSYGYQKYLYESPKISLCMGSTAPFDTDDTTRTDYLLCNGCGSYGLNNNPDNTTKPPCHIMVDVNGDRKPNPNNVNCKDITCAEDNIYKFSDPSGLKLTDLFSIMITDKQAIPYGVAAQKAMYQAQK